jgi:hypothetical protein
MNKYAAAEACRERGMQLYEGDDTERLVLHLTNWYKNARKRSSGRLGDLGIGRAVRYWLGGNFNPSEGRCTTIEIFYGGMGRIYETHLCNDLNFSICQDFRPYTSS